MKKKKIDLKFYRNIGFCIHVLIEQYNKKCVFVLQSHLEVADFGCIVSHSVQKPAAFSETEDSWDSFCLLHPPHAHTYYRSVK